MLIQTQADAQIALQQLANDITNTETTQVPQIGVPDGGIFGFLCINSPGSAGVQEAADATLDQLAGYVQKLYGSFDDPSATLTAQQVAQMQLIQQQVIDARASVQSLISELDWSFGQLVADSLTAARNLADKAVQGGANLLGLTWGQVQVLGLVVGAVVAYALYRRVRG